MQKATVLIIGGGATGTGILRDLCMRGIHAVLLEQGDLASGTSSRFHGLLHSGCRYVVSDPESARECIAENAVLRRIGALCVEDTEGYFIRTPEDDPAYEAMWLAGCKAAGIDVRQISPDEARRREGNLTPDVLAAYLAPDAAIDGFRLVLHNASSARRYGGEVHTYRRVIAVNIHNSRVQGVSTVHALTGEKKDFACDYLVNATGSWGGELARMAGLSLPVTPDRGTLLAFNHRFTSRVVNRLRKPGDGDIFVPHGSITIFGTTSIPTDRPDDTTPTSEEIFYLLGLGEPLFPNLREYRMLRAFAGTRPLYTPDAASGRAATRNFVILDHEDDGLSGMVSITGGKLCTYRLMAEKVSNIAAAALGNNTPCRTAEEAIIPAADEHILAKARAIFPAAGLELAAARMGDALDAIVATVEKNPWKKLLLCECELVTLAEFVHSASEENSHSLDDIRRRTRLGMGTCQGTFCALRAAGALAEAQLLRGRSPQDIFRQFLQERWTGIRPLLWGHQLREIELERGTYGATLNIDGACDADPTTVAEGNAAPVQNAVPTEASMPAGAGQARRHRPAAYAAIPERHCDVIVVGTGFAGLISAAAAAKRGKKTMLISRGSGALVIGGGTIDLLGYTDHGSVSGNPFAAMKQLPANHPYRLLGTNVIRDALEFMRNIASQAGEPLLQAGTENNGNAWLPTAAGTMKPVWLAGPAMNPAALAKASSYAVVGFTGMKDFSPHLVAAGLERCPQFNGKTIRHAMLPSPLPQAANAVRDGNTLDMARYMDTPEGLAWLQQVLPQAANGAEAALIPAILGTKAHTRLHSNLEHATGMIIQELFCPPPSVTGLRTLHLLRDAMRGMPVSFVEGAFVSEAVTEGRRCRALVVSGSDTDRRFHAESFIIATGGTFGNGCITGPGYALEGIFKIPLSVPRRQEDWSHPLFFGRESHFFARMGIAVDSTLRPVSPAGEPLFDNVFFAGRSLAGYDHALEKSGSGVALCTGYHAGMSV